LSLFFFKQVAQIMVPYLFVEERGSEHLAGLAALDVPTGIAALRGALDTGLGLAAAPADLEVVTYQALLLLSAEREEVEYDPFPRLVR
jgi:hypothetical protein